MPSRRGGLNYIKTSVTVPVGGACEGAARKSPSCRCERDHSQCRGAGFLTVGVFASLYAGFIAPEFRVTALSLSAVINGVATILLFVLIDPQLSVMTDDVIEGQITEGAVPPRRGLARRQPRCRARRWRRCCWCRRRC